MTETRTFELTHDQTSLLLCALKTHRWRWGFDFSEEESQLTEELESLFDPEKKEV